MEVFMMPQRSPEWFAARKGVFTSSEMGLWVSKEKRTKKDESSALSAISEKLAEKSGAEMPPPTRPTWAMERGTELEPEAREAYEKETGRKVEEVGFVLHSNGDTPRTPFGNPRRDSRSIQSIRLLMLRPYHWYPNIIRTSCAVRPRENRPICSSHHTIRWDALPITN